MSGWELTLPPKRMDRNPKTGRFIKGRTPHNKGRKWSEWMSKRGQKRVAKCFKNIIVHRHIITPGWNKRAVVAIDSDGRWAVVESATAAAKKVGTTQCNITRCCILNRDAVKGDNHKCRGIRFYYEDDEKWTTKIRG